MQFCTINYTLKDLGQNVSLIRVLDPCFIYYRVVSIYAHHSILKRVTLHGFLKGLVFMVTGRNGLI